MTETDRGASIRNRLGQHLAERGHRHLRRDWVAIALNTQRTGAPARLASGVRWASAAVFIVFGIGKFTNHASELASFRQYALPAPDAFVYAIGGLEIAGGLLLAVGLLVRPAALALAGDMIGAIVVSGLGRGEQVSLTLAPLLLGAMCFLVWMGAGSWALDTRLTAASASTGRRLVRWRAPR